MSRRTGWEMGLVALLVVVLMAAVCRSGSRGRPVKGNVNGVFTRA
jgi:hypothetical protein